MPSRREFVQVTAAATAATVLRARGVLGANERINVGLIGCGGRGSGVWQRFLKQPDVNPVAVSDVYEPFLRRTAGETIAAVKDFRRLLDRKDIDAVIVATPDHWHAIQTVMACEAGKDVYCEKPLSLTVREGRLMSDAARRHKRVVQTGSQQRSGAHYAKAVKLMQDGAIGPVHKITASFTRNVIPGFVARELKAGLTADLNFPDASLGGGRGCVVTWTGREIGSSRGGPLVFHGTKGALSLSRGGFTVAPETWRGEAQGEKPVMEGMEEPRSEMEISHVRNFLDCMKSRNRPVADVEEGHRTATMCHLGNIATRLGRGLRWDAEKQEFVGDADANRRLHYEYRKPWKLRAS